MSQPQFQQIVAAAAQEKMIHTNSTVGTPLAANGAETIDIYAPNNTICEISMLNVYAGAPGGSTTGNHEMWIQNTASMKLLHGKSTFSSAVELSFGEWTTADIQKQPSTTPPMQMIANMKFDSQIGVRFQYVNSTNVIQSNGRSYEMFYKQRTVG